MDERVLHPTEIQDMALPGQVDTSSPVNQSTGTGVSAPTTVKNTSFPSKKIAVELLSTALNTRSKKILQEFELVQEGGFRAGKYENGVSGEVAITPAGITARNKAGNTTLAIDGDTGDAVFAGQIQSGSLISGLVVVGQNIEIDGENETMIFYNDGLPSIVIGEV